MVGWLAAGVQVRLLLQGKADVNAVDENGGTCLHALGQRPSGSVVETVAEILAWCEPIIEAAARMEAAAAVVVVVVVVVSVVFFVVAVRISSSSSCSW